jgi:release factor glutamine methyltransferase
VVTVKDILLRTAALLTERGTDAPRLEAELLLADVLGLGRMELYLAFERPLEDTELARLRPLVRRRANREPLYWILGRKGFHDIELLCHPGVLVPRADTEALVEAVLARLPPDWDGFVADVGAGTGAVGLALAHARPGARIYATDLSDAALENTRANVAALDLGKRVAVLQGSLLDPVPAHRPVDVVVSNPPYIATRVLDALDPEVARHEPRLALDGGRDGLDAYRALLPEAARRCRLGVAVEIGHDQGPAVARLFGRAGLVDVQVLPDLAGRERVVLGRRRDARWPVEPPPAARPTGDLDVVLDDSPPPDGPLVAAELVLDEAPAWAPDEAADAPALDENGQPLPVFDADR